jgi:hypothetical protein
MKQDEDGYSMALLATVQLMEAIRPPTDGGHYADDEKLKARALACLSAATAWFEGEIGQPIALEPATFRLNGTGGAVLSVPRKPVSEITSLVVNNQPWTVIGPEDVDTGQDAMIASNGFYLIARRCWWPRGVGNVQLSASFGYNPIPNDIQHSVAMFASVLMLEANFLGFGGETIGPEHINMLARNPKDYGFILRTLQFYGYRMLF